MSTREITTSVTTCDFCNKQIQPCESVHTETCVFRYGGGEAIGIELRWFPFGPDYTDQYTDICKSCYISALRKTLLNLED